MKKLLFVFFTCLTLGSCEYKCGEFPQFMEEYLPYQMGQIVNFKNNKGELMELKVIYCSVEQPFSAHSTACNCRGEKLVGLEDHLSNTSIYFISFQFFTIMKNRNVSNGIVLHGEFYFDDRERNSCKYSKMGFDPYIEENAGMINSTIEMYGNENTRINRMKIERGKGLVEFDDVINNCTWKLVE